MRLRMGLRLIAGIFCTLAGMASAQTKVAHEVLDIVRGQVTVRYLLICAVVNDGDVSHLGLCGWLWWIRNR